MKPAALRLPGTLIGLLALHEAALRALAASDLPSVLFAPGDHSPVLYLALTVGFLLLRLTVYFCVPFGVAVWVALRGVELLSAAAARRASVGASSSRVTQH